MTNDKLIKYSKIVVFVLILVFYASSVTYKIDLPAAQDLPREINNGEMILKGNYDVLTKNVYSYTEPNQPFANHQWFSGVVFFLLYQAVGWDGMVIFKVIFILLTFCLLFYITAKRSNFWLVTLFSIPAIIILFGRSALRPEIFSYLLIIVYFYLLFDFEKNPESKKIYWLIPLELLWVSLHLYFPIGILMTGGFFLEKIILHFKNNPLQQNPYAKKLFLILVGMILVIFINPYGLSRAVFALQVNKDANFPVASAELTSLPQYFKTYPKSDNIPAVTFEIFAPILILSFIWALIFRWYKKQPLLSDNYIFYLLASIGTIGLGFYIIRALPFFAIIFLLAMSNNLKGSYFEFKEWIKNKWPKREKIVVFASIIFLITVLLYLILHDLKKTNWADFGIGITSQSEGSEKFFKENNLIGPIFNDSDIGSYLIYYLFPKERVFSDNRFGDAYSASFFSDTYLPMIRYEDKWQEGLKKYSFNVLFINHYNGIGGMRDFIYRRINDPQWAWVYADDYAVILVKNVTKNRAVIEKYQITWDNIESRLSYLSESENLDEQLAYADLLNLSGHQYLAMNSYMKFLSERPYAGKVWYALGSTELNLYDLSYSNPSRAIIYLNEALTNGWKAPETYSYLALAYFRLGEYDKAREAVNEEIKINPDSEDVQKWLDTFSGMK